MPILLAGSEGEIGIFSNTLDSRGTDAFHAGSYIVEVEDGILLSPNFIGTDDMWFHFRFRPEYSTSVSGAATPVHSILFRDSNDVNLFGLYSYSNSGKSRVPRFRASITQTYGGTLEQPGDLFTVDEDNKFANLDIHAVVTTATDPNDTLTLTYYWNNVKRFEASYVDAVGWTSPNYFRYRGQTAGTGLGGLDTIYYQDIIVTDGVPTVGKILARLTPNAVGNYTDWDGDYTDVDEAGYNAFDEIIPTTTGDRESWTYPAPNAALGDRNISALIATIVATGGVYDINPFVRISSTDYDAAAFATVSGDQDALSHVWTANPATASAWTAADLSGLELGIRAV